LERTLASLRDASPALERAAPQRVCPSSFENRGIGFAGIFSGNLYIFPAPGNEPCTTPFREAAIAASGSKPIVHAHQEPEAVSGGRSQAGVFAWQGGDSAG